MKTTKSLLAIAAAVTLASCKSIGAPVALPPALEVTPGESWVGTLSASGVQVYQCRDRDGRPAWAFSGPLATLYDRDGRSVGHHGAGPFWEADDGSRVEGKVLATAAAPAEGAVPWLLLETRSTGGPGMLASVSRIRRVDTVGGSAPTRGCDANSYGALREVPYTAAYRLYAIR